MNRQTPSQAARLLAAAGLLFVGIASAQTTPSRIDSESLKDSKPVEFVFLRDQGPLLVRLHIMQGDEPISRRWQKYVNEWFDFLDRDQDGALSETMLAGAPNAAGMRNLAAQGAFFPNRGVSATLGDFGKTGGQTVSRAEFAEYYRKNGISPVQGGPGPQESAAQANDALFKALDTDRDGKLSRVEVEAASRAIAKLDTDDDELVNLRELGGGGAPVAVRGAVDFARVQPPAGPLQGTSYVQLSTDNSRVGLATLMLARYDKKKRMTVTQKEIGLDDASFRRLDENRNGSLDLMELARFPQNAPAVELVVHLGNNSSQPVSVFKSGALPETAVRPGPGVLTLALGDADIAVQNQSAGAVRPVVNQFGFIVQQLKAADTKMRGYVELSDLQNPQQQFLKTLFPILDRNEDFKVTEQEAQAYFNLQDKARTNTTTFFVQEQGRNFFQILDSNRDGQLSPRELMTAWQRLASYDKTGDGSIEATELPLQFRVVFGAGINQQFVVAAGGRMGMEVPGRTIYPDKAPLWFKKMDRNRDGDVSHAEFLGAREEFDRIDANRDGLIDAREAAAAPGTTNQEPGIRKQDSDGRKPKLDR